MTGVLCTVYGAQVLVIVTSTNSILSMCINFDNIYWIVTFACEYDLNILIFVRIKIKWVAPWQCLDLHVKETYKISMA